MDIISQLQEQVNTIAALAFNTFGTLQRDAPPVRLSPNYPEPPPANPTEDSANVAEQPKQMSAAFVKAAKQVKLHTPYLHFFCLFINEYEQATDQGIKVICVYFENREFSLFSEDQDKLFSLVSFFV